MPETRERVQALRRERTSRAAVAVGAPGATPAGGRAPRVPTAQADGPPTGPPTPLAVPFCGRHAELAGIQSLFAEARRGALRVACITGPSGIGKTRLLDEALAALGGVRLLRATCYETPPPAPYQALAEAFRDAGVQELGPFDRGAWPMVADGADAALERRVWERLVATLGGLARSGPLALAIDDVQWADPALVRSLPYLIRRLAACTLLLLLTCRREDRPSGVAELLRELARRGTMATFELPPLGAADLGRLVQAYRGDQASSDVLTAELLEETEGNPFFAVEMLRDVHERAEPSADNHVSLPRTVEAAIEARLSRLPASARQVADVAAVIGRDVDLETLRRASGVGEAALVERIELLEQAGLLGPLPDSRRPGYRFSHGKLQALIYDRLGTARRRLLHRGVARALGRAHGQHPGLAAQQLDHARRAGEWETAFAAARRAAAEARRLAAFAEAAELEGAALEALEELAGRDGAPARRVAVLLQREDDAFRIGRRPAQAEDLDELERHALAADRVAEVLYRRGRYLVLQGRPAEARPVLEQALEAAAGADSGPDAELSLRCAICIDLARALERLGSVSEAVELVGRALEDAVGRDRARCRLQACLALAELAQLRDDRDGAVAWLERARPLARLSPESEARVWRTLAWSRLRQGGDYPQMLRDAARADAAYVLLGDLAGQAQSRMLQGLALGRLHRFGEAAQTLETALALFRAVEDPRGESMVLMNLAVQRFRIGDWAGAAAGCQATYTLAGQTDDERGRCLAALNLSAAHTMLGDGRLGERWARTALPQLDALGLPLHTGTAYANLGAALLQQGRLEEAHRAHREALQHQPADDVNRASALAWLAFNSAALGDLTAADEQSAAAQAALAERSGVDFPQLIHAVRAFVLDRLGDRAGANAALDAARGMFDAVLANIPSPADRAGYRRNFPTNRFIRAAAAGDWTSQHPLL